MVTPRTQPSDIMSVLALMRRLWSKRRLYAGDIMRINDRKLATMMGFLSAIRNFWILAATIHTGTFTEFYSTLSSSTQTSALFVAGFLSLIITAILLTPMKLNKLTLLTMLLASVAAFYLSVIPTSLSVLFMLPLPWSLFSLHLLENIKTPRINGHTTHVTL